MLHVFIELNSMIKYKSYNLYRKKVFKIKFQTKNTLKFNFFRKNNYNKF